MEHFEFKWDGSAVNWGHPHILLSTADIYDGLHAFELFVFIFLRGQFCGLHGNYNGNPNNTR